MLALWRPQEKPLLPHLIDICPHDYNDDSLPFFHLFLGAHLRILSLDNFAIGDVSYTGLLSVFRALPSQAHLLEDLSLGPSWAESSKGDMGRIIGELKHLREVSVSDLGPCDMEVSHVLSRLPLLERLQVDDFKNFPPLDAEYGAEPLWPKLNSLKVWQLGGLAPLIQHAPLRQLRNLVLICTQRSISKNRFLRLFNPTDRTHRLEQLRALQISVVSIDGASPPLHPHPEFAFDIDVFRYVSFSKNLRNLLVMNHHLVINNAVIRHLAMSLPMLDCLSLTRAVYSTATHEVTIEALVPLLKYC